MQEDWWQFLFLETKGMKEYTLFVEIRQPSLLDFLPVIKKFTRLVTAALFHSHDHFLVRFDDKSGPDP